MTPEQLENIKLFQKNFDASANLEGVNTGMPFTCGALGGELGELAEAMYLDRDLSKSREELTDIFIYAVILSNQLDHLPLMKDNPFDQQLLNEPVLEIPLAIKLAIAIGRVNEAVKKHHRAKVSQNVSEFSRFLMVTENLDDLFRELRKGAERLGFDLNDAYYAKMAKNQLSISKYRG